MAEWLKGCEVCDAGLVAQMDELIEQGLSERKAAKELATTSIKSLCSAIYLRKPGCPKVILCGRCGRW